MTGFEHGDADQAEGNHVYDKFLMKGGGRLTMPGGGAQGVLKIPKEGFDVPAHGVEAGQFRSGKQTWV